MRARDQSFLPGFHPARSADRSHGGGLRPGKRKIARPFDPKQALHVTLRSSKARGEWSLLSPRNHDKVHDFTQRIAAKHGVRLYRFANVGNHVHLLLRARTRTALQRFLRELSGGLAQILTGARKGMGLARSQGDAIRGFWDTLAFSRIVSAGRDFQNVARYLVKNLFEAAGIPIKRLAAQGYRLYSIEKDGRVIGVGPVG